MSTRITLAYGCDRIFSLLFPEGNREFVSQQPAFFEDLQMGSL